MSNEKLCPYCGAKLIETTWGRKFCRNCGVLDSTEESEEKNPKYIG